MDKQPKAEVKFITPSIATKLLELNTHNRKIVNAHVEYLMREMVNGRWYVNNDSIVIDWNQRLGNGQHRLWAVTLAPELDSSFEGVHMQVLTGADPKSQATMDIGKTRQLHDLLTLDGNIGTVTPMHTAVARAMAGGLEGRRKAFEAYHDYKDFVVNHIKALDFGIKIFPTAVKGVSSAAVRAVLARAFYHADISKLEHFASVLVSGVPQTNNDIGAVKLKIWLLSTSFSKNSDKFAGEIYARTERTLYDYLHENERDILARVTNKELFPLPAERKSTIKTLAKPIVIREPDVEPDFVDRLFSE